MKTYNFRAEITVNGVPEYRDFTFTAADWNAARRMLAEAVRAASS